MSDHRVDPRIAAAVRQLRRHYPDADPVIAASAVIDAHEGLAAFGFSDDEQSVTLITEIAAIDPRLRAPAEDATPS